MCVLCGDIATCSHTHTHTHTHTYTRVEQQSDELLCACVCCAEKWQPVHTHAQTYGLTYQVSAVEPVPVLEVLREEGHGVLRPVGLDEGEVEVVEEKERAVALRVFEWSWC